MNSVLAPISIGELFDKITILEIKLEKIIDVKKILNVKKELNELKKIEKNVFCSIQNIKKIKVKDYISQLKDVNLKLWDIEEKKRSKEKLTSFDDEFIQLARSVYIHNDQRAHIKKQINILTNSQIIEEKSYEELSSNS